MQTFANWITLKENEAARLAVEQVVDCVCKAGPRRAINPLFIHGPSGTGKSHLVSALLAEVAQRSPNLQTALLAKRDLETYVFSEHGHEKRKSLQHKDLLIIEDLQYLPA